MGQFGRCESQFASSTHSGFLSTRHESDASHPEGRVELLVSFGDLHLENLIMWSLKSDLLTGKGAPGPRFLWVSLCLGQWPPQDP